MAKIGRLITAMVTPFNARGEVDYKQAQKLARALIDSGSDGLVVTGTTGERPTVTDEEQLKLFATVRDAIGRQGDHHRRHRRQLHPREHRHHAGGGEAGG